MVNEAGETLLYWANRRGFTNVTNFLLKAGANPNLADNIGVTPFHWAAEIGYITPVQLLLEV